MRFQPFACFADEQRRLGNRLRQPETFAKSITDGAAVACRHFSKQQSSVECAIYNNEPPPFHFKFQAASSLLQKSQPETIPPTHFQAAYEITRQPETRKHKHEQLSRRTLAHTRNPTRRQRLVRFQSRAARTARRRLYRRAHGWRRPAVFAVCPAPASPMDGRAMCPRGGGGRSVFGQHFLLDSRRGAQHPFWRRRVAAQLVHAACARVVVAAVSPSPLADAVAVARHFRLRYVFAQRGQIAVANVAGQRLVRPFRADERAVFRAEQPVFQRHERAAAHHRAARLRGHRVRRLFAGV